MNDTAIKNYATWARRELIAQVQRRCARYGILEEGSLDAAADAIDGRVLSSQEKKQRARLLSMAASDGWQELVEKAAYTWFNRLLAIRFMEVNDRLPSHVRVLSAQDGSFAPQALSEAMDLPLPGLDHEEAARLVQEGDDEALFRRVFLAQCDQLADCMPAVFSHVGGAMELLLPDGLLRTGGVVEQLVTAIPEDDWREGVEIVGWMYQYYVSERKDEVFAGFKKGKKAERGSIAPATQLFTPNWIVRYLTENSLGRLWVLNHPESALPGEMPYFVKPDEDHETEFRRVHSPEEVTVVDPACGSGHILVYAFELLFKMYVEVGYSARDAARLIVEKNLTGMEIDPRAAAMASFAVTMKACEYDSRFLRREVTPKITVLDRVELSSEELDLCPNMLGRRELVDAAAHLDECGSLLRPTADDLAAIEGDLASLAGDGTVFASGAREKLEQLRAELEPLARRYDVVVANPPYMGSGNMNKWLSAWVKQRYKDAKSDLCTCFIERGRTLAVGRGYVSMITASSWMFISSFEAFRKKLLATSSICSMIQQSTHGYAGVTVPTTMFVLAKDQLGVTGSYIRLEDFDRPQWQEPKALEALADPDCGWYFKADADSFSAIPGNQIVYWASEKIKQLCLENAPLERDVLFKEGITTGNNDVFLRFWHEPSYSHLAIGLGAKRDGRYWVPCNKGGGFRRWYGNNDYVIDWTGEGSSLSSYEQSSFRNAEYQRKEGVTYSNLSTGAFSARYSPLGFAFESKGTTAFSIDPVATLAYLNSSLFGFLAQLVCPTLDYKFGILQRLPCLLAGAKNEIVMRCISMAKQDYDSFETSWDFAKHPLIK